ncbi:MAG: hypothetical protein LBR85_03350 [Oscillospiraceae bacterium]|nr:hypothetical protein [Oscillospiraceae bacterium]
MSLPAFPDKPEGYSIEDSISQILTSIAMEEIGLSHILNSEGEKLQYVLGTLTDASKPNPTIPEILEVNESVKDMLGVVSTNQMFLFGKMSAALNAHFKNQTSRDSNGGDTPPDKPPDKPPILAVPSAADGRILTPQKTGDTAEWVEIAQNGGYSLIVRTKFINTFGSLAQKDNPDYQATAFGTSNAYGGSAVRNKINDWFTGAASVDADNLAADANLRKFTMKSNAAVQTGTGTAGPGGKGDSFSKPVAQGAPSGLDVAFALSYSEAANFISDEYGWGGDNFTPSDTPAQSNFAKLQLPEGSQFWLRSPGSDSDMAASLSQSGRVFQSAVDGSNGGLGLLYPALWVDSSVF